jgi:hypothetical protein
VWSRDVSVRCKLVSPEQHFSRVEGIDSICLAVCLDLEQPDALTRRRGLRGRTRRAAEHVKVCASSRAPRAARVRVVLFSAGAWASLRLRALAALAAARIRVAAKCSAASYTGGEVQLPRFLFLLLWRPCSSRSNC